MTMCTACAHEESVARKPSGSRKPTPKGKKAEAKISKVMGEYKSGELKSSSGQEVTNPKQAKAIALNSARKKKA